MRLFWSMILLLACAGGAAAWWEWRADGDRSARLMTDQRVADVEDRASIGISPSSPGGPPGMTPTPGSPGVELPSEATGVELSDPPANARGIDPGAGTGHLSTEADGTDRIVTKAPEGTDGEVIAAIPGTAPPAIPGRGTPHDPFRIDWDLLLSARHSYDPPAGKLDLPPAVTMLNGSVVRITGYFTAPIGEERTSELLVMMNRWDGCCLGLPPTPYDAIEAKLEEPIRLTGQHMIRYGTVTGTFFVDPFLIGDMIMGLYRIEDARVEWGG